MADAVTPDVVRAWRLVKARWADAAFDGEGARRYGGRWNSVGTRVAYASESAALAVLEVLVHLQSSAALGAYVLVPVDVPVELVQSLPPDALPPDWRLSPPPASARAIGDAWVREGRAVALWLPRAVVEAERKLLLNPAHADFAGVRVGEARPFAFDPRLRDPGAA